VRTCRSRAADAAAAPADDAAATLHQKKVASREADAARNCRSRAAASVDRMQLMPLLRLQTTRRPRFTSRRRWQVVRLMLRAGISRVQLMPLPRSMCVERSVCAAAEAADDAAAALHEQEKVVSREADAARKRPSRAARCRARRRCGGRSSRSEQSGASRG